MAEPSLVSQNPIVNVPSPTKGFVTFGAQQGIQNVATQNTATSGLQAQTAAKDTSVGQRAAAQATLQLRQQQLAQLRASVAEESANADRLAGQQAALQSQLSSIQQQTNAAINAAKALNASNDHQ